MSFNDGFSVKPIPFVQPLAGTASMLISSPDGTRWIASDIIENAISASVYVIETIETEGNIDGNGAPEDKVRLRDAISLSSVTASFSGDGNKVTNITASNIANFTRDVRLQLTGSQYLNYDNVSGTMSLPFTGTIVGTTPLILGESTHTLTGLTSLSSSGLTGSGTNITDLTASNITNFTNDVRLQLSGSQYVDYNKTSGIMSLPFTGSVVGSSPVILGETTPSLSGLTSVSAVSLTGSGTNITDLTASNITNFTVDVRAQLTGSQYVDYNKTTGLISLPFTGSTIGTTPVILGQTVTTITGLSSISASTGLFNELTASKSKMSTLQITDLTATNIYASNIFEGTSSVQSLAANTQIVPSTSLVKVSSSTGLDIVLTASPTIKTAGYTEGLKIYVVNVGTGKVTFTKDVAPGTTGLKLVGGKSFAAGELECIQFVLVSGSSGRYWVEANRGA